MKFAVFTSVDGALLDPETFDPGPNLAMVRHLHAGGVPVIPMTAMTLEEVAPIARDFGMEQAMVIEAGAAVALWLNGAWQVEPCGPSADTVLDVIREIEDQSGADLDVQLADGVSEPFLIERGDLAEVTRAARSIGFSVRRGRRFLHLCRECDLGEAFARVRNELRSEVAIAIGNSAVHADFMSRADIPIIIPDRDGEPDPELLARVPGARVAPASAPDGWAAALREVWPAFAAPIS
jgi:hypothetical protein